MEHIEQTGFVNEATNPVRPLVTTYFDEGGWLSVDPIEGRSTTAPVPSVNLAPGYAWNYVGAPGREWVAIERNPAPAPAPAVPPNPTEWLIDVGPFFDRFGAAKMAILVSQNATVRAIVSDLQVRKWVDLKRADVGQGIDALAALGVAGVTPALKTAVLTTPVTADENLALRKLFF